MAIALRKEYFYALLFWAGTLCCIYESKSPLEIIDNNDVEMVEEESQAPLPVVQVPKKVIEYFHKVIRPQNLKKTLKDLDIPWAEGMLKKAGLKKTSSEDRLFVSLKRSSEDGKPSVCEARYFASDDVYYVVNPAKKLVQKRNCKRIVKRISGVVNRSLHDVVQTYNMPNKTYQECVRAVQHCVNLKNIRKGKKFDILYTVVQMPNGDCLFPKFKYVSIDHKHKVYAWPQGFYNEHGKYLGKDAVRPPIRAKNVRIGSRFGMRRDPIHQGMRMHYGVDFNAPTGTPVYSIASGVVVKAGYNGGYGNTVEVQHAGGHTTRYAHLRKIHAHVGMRVNDQTVLGQVGMSGRTTGPHLHFEIFRGKTRVNPLQVHTFGSKDLAGPTLVKFQQFRRNVDVQLASTSPEKAIGKIG